jgi:hypothetical protein
MSLEGDKTGMIHFRLSTLQSVSPTRRRELTRAGKLVLLFAFVPHTISLEILGYEGACLTSNVVGPHSSYLVTCQSSDRDTPTAKGISMLRAHASINTLLDRVKQMM